MAHFPIEGLAGSSPVNQVDTSPRHPLGFEMDMVDTVLGSGKFIYMKGVASTVAGSVVTWDASEATPSYQTALNVATANAGQQLAVAMAPILAGQYGWYCLQGTVPVATNGTLAGAGVVYAVTGGQITSSATAGKGVNNMRAKTATGTPAAGQAYCQFAYPFGEGVVA
jgi:hypothetical protein